MVVNPTDWDATVELVRLHRDVSSGQVDRRFVVPRLDGRILLPSDGPIEAGGRTDTALDISAGGTRYRMALCETRGVGGGWLAAVAGG